MGPGKLKSNPNDKSILHSRSISDCLDTFLYSSSVSKFIILLKLGETGYSSLAAINILIVANFNISFLGKFMSPTILIYRSRILAATNNVSSLYSFFVCRSKIFWIPYDLSLIVIIFSKF